MRSWLLPLVALLALSPTIAEEAQSARIARVERTLRPAVTIRGDPGWTIEERMEHYGVPGVGIAVIQDFEVVWFKTYGMADRETRAPVTPDTLFQAGSVSKPVAALGALTLVAKGRLTLDGDVNDTLKTWHLPDNEFSAGESVTLTRLLSHTGGLTVHGFPGYAVGQPVPSLVQVLDGLDPANTPAVRIDTVPGSLWRYSGGGYTVAQQMMIDATGKSFPVLMRKLVLAPIGMKHSTFENPLPGRRLKDAAAGYLPDKSPVEGKRHTYPEMAAAGLWTTAEDLAIFALELQRALRGESKVVARATAQRMVEPVEPGYGRGFALTRREDSPYFGHGGWDEGFCAQLTAQRDDGYGVAVMINSNHPEFIDELIRAVAQEYGWAGYRIYDKLAVPEFALERYPGRYRYNAEQSFTIHASDGRLFLQYVGGDPEELLYVGAERFMRRERSAPITFTEADGVVQFHFVVSDGELQTHPPLADGVRAPRELLVAGPYDEALAAYRAILEENPEEDAVSEGYLNNQGLAMLSAGRIEQAIAMLRIATDLYPDSANTWDSLGYAYREAGDRAKAIEYYKLALERDPGFRSALRALAELESE